MDKVYYYGKTMPDVGEVVFAKVKRISDISVSCELVEYGGIDAMIPSTELSRRKHNSISSLTRVGKLEPAIVIRNENGFIDLSRKRVDRDELQEAEKRFYGVKKLISVLHHYSQTSGKDFQDLMRRIAHKWGDDGVEKTDATADEIEFIRQKLESQSKMTMRCCFNATYYGNDGIETLKDVFSGSLYPVKYLSAPSYSIELECTNEKDGYKKLMCEITKMKDTLEKKGGTFEIKTMPHIANKNMVEEVEDENEEEVEDNNTESSYESPS